MPKLDLANETLLQSVERNLNYKRNEKANVVVFPPALYALLEGKTKVGRVKLEEIDSDKHGSYHSMFVKGHVYVIGRQATLKGRPRLEDTQRVNFLPGLSADDQKEILKLAQWGYTFEAARRMLAYSRGEQDLALTLTLMAPELVKGLRDPLLVIAYRDNEWYRPGVRGLVDGGGDRRYYASLGPILVEGVEVADSFTVGHFDLRPAPGSVTVIDGRRVVREVEYPSAPPLAASVLEIYVTLVNDTPDLTPIQALEMAQALTAA